eukprot:1331260-Rhodomonas_salina.1
MLFGVHSGSPLTLTLSLSHLHGLGASGQGQGVQIDLAIPLPLTHSHAHIFPVSVINQCRSQVCLACAPGMGFGIHYGWGIECAIGSQFKIEASYLSPH